ncbi:hypothetical protein C8R45DRAFT_1007276 [Mycena sanguinolenta]|nr:hypothetical protein C8R45DRAFT_1007276 [Mycena sanguinolenta]
MPSWQERCTVATVAEHWNTHRHVWTSPHGEDRGCVRTAASQQVIAARVAHTIAASAAAAGARYGVANDVAQDISRRTDSRHSPSNVAHQRLHTPSCERSEWTRNLAHLCPAIKLHKKCRLHNPRTVPQVTSAGTRRPRGASWNSGILSATVPTGQRKAQGL